jgi:hypothetical protein
MVWSHGERGLASVSGHGVILANRDGQSVWKAQQISNQLRQMIFGEVEETVDGGD